MRRRGTGQTIVACVALVALCVGCAKSASSNLPPSTPSPTASLQEQIVGMGQQVTTAAGNRVTIFSYVAPVTGGRSPGAGMMFSAAEVKACAGPHPSADTGVVRAQFAVETPGQTGWASVDPVKKPALKDTVLKANQCVRGWITFRVPPTPKAQYVVLVSTTIVKWRIP